jgi:hypothetical protein
LATTLSHGAEVHALPAAQSYRFEHGYNVIDEGGKVLKVVPGPTEAIVAAYRDVDGTRHYMSDWSFERYRSQNQKPNWIVAILPPSRQPEPPFPLLPGLAGGAATNYGTGADTATKALMIVQRALELIRDRDAQSAFELLLTVDPRDRDWLWAYSASKLGFAPIPKEEVLAANLATIQELRMPAESAGAGDADTSGGVGSNKVVLDHGTFVTYWSSGGRSGGHMAVNYISPDDEKLHVYSNDTGMYGEVENANVLSDGNAVMLHLSLGGTSARTNQGFLLEQGGEILASLPNIAYTSEFKDPDHILLKFGTDNMLDVVRMDDYSLDVPLIRFDLKLGIPIRPVFDRKNPNRGSVSLRNLWATDAALRAKYADEHVVKWRISDGGTMVTLLSNRGILQVLESNSFKPLYVLNKIPYSEEVGGVAQGSLDNGTAHEIAMVPTGVAGESIVAAMPVGKGGGISVYRVGAAGGSLVAEMKNSEGNPYSIGEHFNEATSTTFKLRPSPQLNFVELVTYDRNYHRTIVWDGKTGKMLFYDPGGFNVAGAAHRKCGVIGVLWVDDESVAFVLWENGAVDAFKGDFSLKLGSLNLSADDVMHLGYHPPLRVPRSPCKKYIALGHVILQASSGEPVLILPEGSVVNSGWDKVAELVPINDDAAAPLNDDVAEPEAGKYLTIIDVSWWTQPDGAIIGGLSQRILAHQMKSVFVPASTAGGANLTAP